MPRKRSKERVRTIDDQSPGSSQGVGSPEVSVSFEERAYQDEAVKLALASLYEHGGYACFMEQRTGKTIVACRVAHQLNPPRILVIGPEIAQQVWDEHIDQFYLITAKRGNDRILYVTRDQVFKLRKKLRRWVQKEDTLVIVDEGHDYKDPHSKRSRGLRIIGRKAKWRLLLTGTPQESGLEDYWAQFDFVDPKLFGEWAAFKAHYLVYGGFKGKKIIRYLHKDEFQEKLHSRSYRVLLEDVKPVKTDLGRPMKIEFTLDASRVAYSDMEKKFITMLNTWVMRKELQADGSYTFVKRRKFVAAALVIKQAMKLHQLSGGWVFDDERQIHRFGEEKLTTAGCLMLAIGEDVPQVWYVRFLPELYRLGHLFRLLGREVTFISGDHKTYHTGDSFDVAIVQVASGQSIDLAHAGHSVFYSWDYSHLKHDQAKFRIRAYHAVFARYYYLIGRHTIDSQLYDAVMDKTSFATLILDRFRR